MCLLYINNSGYSFKLMGGWPNGKAFVFGPVHKKLQVRSLRRSFFFYSSFFPWVLQFYSLALLYISYNLCGTRISEF